MKSFFSFFVINACIVAGSLLLFTTCSAKQAHKLETVVVYTYDSFAAEWGPGPEIAKRFKEATGYTVEYVVYEDSGVILSQAVAEKNSPRADILLGLNSYMIEKARAESVFEPYRPKRADEISKELVLTDDWLVTPYDWGYFTVMYDTQSNIPQPKSLEELTLPQYEKSLIIMDPRISSPGLGFAAWTKAVYGPNYLSYWKRLKPSILTMSHSWSSGYGLFTAGEAPLVISYTTSMAYHIRYDNTDRYQALLFPEGHVIEIEVMGVTKNAPNKKAAHLFLDFMLSNQAQEILPETQWMYPVSNTVALPASFKSVPNPQKTLRLAAKEIQSAINEIILQLEH